MKYPQARKRAKAYSFIGGAIPLLVALSVFAGCSVHGTDDSTSGGGYTASDLAGSYTGSSTLNAKLLEIMQNCTDPAWTEWLEEKYPSLIQGLGNDGFKTTGVTSTSLTLSAGSSFKMTIIYQSTLTSTVYNQDGELEISGTWSVSGSDVAFTYTTSNVEDDWDTAPSTMAGIVKTLVNGSELRTDGSSLYGRFGYSNYWTSASDTLFTKQN